MSRILKKNEMLKNQESCPFCGKDDMIELSVAEEEGVKVWNRRVK